MSEYDIEWSREVLKYVCGISFLIVATCVFIVVFFDVFPSSIIDTILDTLYVPFLLSGVISGWMIVIVDTVLMIRGNEDE